MPAHLASHAQLKSTWAGRRDARGAGPLAMTGFQDLQKHSVWYDYGHKALALGVLYIMNKVLAIACRRAGITFPSPLIGAWRSS